ncbi:MAG: glutathione S-transferase N-terminal domain-containing protein [Myxococcota bacterium]
MTASMLRGGRGFIARPGGGTAPAQPLELFDFEACPFCRKVREILSELDLTYVARTCARGSATREVLRGRGGKELFPYLVDPNTGQEMYESEDIVDYLLETYGGGARSAWRRTLGAPVSLGFGALASGLRRRGGRVRRARPEPLPERLVLYSFEASPFCRKVREVLCELDLDAEIRNVARGGRRRPELVARGGKMMVPYLIDPNRGREMYESDDIIAYLDATYG